MYEKKQYCWNNNLEIEKVFIKKKNKRIAKILVFYNKIIFGET
jgi:hypothetical protein